MGDGSAENLLLRWWREPDAYEWRIEFLRSRGLLSVLRYIIAGIGAVLGILGAINAVIPPVAGVVYQVGWAVVSIGSLAWAALWAFRPWPSERASCALLAYVDVIITLSALLFGDPNLAMSSIPLLLCAGGYVVFFHGPRLHLAHVLWCAVAVTGIAVWLGTSEPGHGPQIAISRAVIALVVTVCILPALQFGFWLLQDSSMQSLTDPLTELTNRRGLAVAMTQLAERTSGAKQLSAFLIDLDGFKGVNDSLGHAIGDQVLVRTAKRIRASVRNQAVVVRWGGEEFLVVDRLPARQAEMIAERIRVAVRAPAHPTVTASIGLAVQCPGDGELESVIVAADTAMYRAKARGGDCVVCAASAD